MAPRSDLRASPAACHPPLFSFSRLPPDIPTIPHSPKNLPPPAGAGKQDGAGSDGAPPLLDPAAGGDAPDGFDPAVAGGGDLLVQVHGGVGIADDKFEAVADARCRRGRLELDGGVLGG